LREVEQDVPENEKSRRNILAISEVSPPVFDRSVIRIYSTLEGEYVHLGDNWLQVGSVLRIGFG
jgi:hypothetical protein